MAKSRTYSLIWLINLFSGVIMHPKDFKYNKEELSFKLERSEGIICKTCVHRQHGVFAGIHGYEKGICDAYPHLKPYDVWHGTSRECPHYERG